MPSTTKGWFITGASSGFGQAFAQHAIEKGYNVIIAARSADKLAKIAEVDPAHVLAVTLDVTDTAHVRTAVEQAMSRFGRIDVLFNNAGYGIVGALEETPAKELRAQMETNFFGAIAMINEVLPIMRRQRAGAIVNISSMGGQLSFPGFGAYSASKFALEGASEALAPEVKPFGIKVLIVEPGEFRTDLAAVLKHMPEMPEYRDTVGGTRAFARGMNGTQKGDPRKAIAAIEKALNDDNTPLRLQLGDDAVSQIRQHAHLLLSDLEKWEAVAKSTAFTDQK